MKFRCERPIRYVCFSGGVAECIYHPGMDVFTYGDIGILLADAIRRSRLFSKFHVIDAKETIRATVIGARSPTQQRSPEALIAVCRWTVPDEEHSGT
ncbi:ethanolamine ammonia-lyase reactivating factor EutA [Hungatella sp.]|uniref:ethanolamine ammonia-lyase reactivating factor EutA n=1 Tax=Hungatella sp. TaxID=2613924 RepID=UPI003992FE80